MHELKFFTLFIYNFRYRYIVLIYELYDYISQMGSCCIINHVLTQNVDFDSLKLNTIFSFRTLVYGRPSVNIPPGGCRYSFRTMPTSLFFGL